MPEVEEELTQEQKEHIAVLRRKFFRAVSVFSVFGTIILLIVLRFTLYNYTTVESYEPYINHKDKFMRFNAAKALGQFNNNPKAIRLLTQMLNDPAREVRWHSGASLAKLKSPLAIPALSYVIPKEKDVSAKSIFIYALGQIKDEKSVDLLINELKKSLSKKDNEKDERVTQFSIIQALAFMDNTKTKSYLTNLAKEDNIPKEMKDFISKMIETKGKVNASEK